MKKKLLVLGMACGMVLAFFLFGGPEHLSLESLKASRQALADVYQARPALMLAGFFAVYVLTAGLSLPGATVLTLAGSAVFGFWAGLAVVSFASSLGAVLACAVSRYLLRDVVRARLGGPMRKIDAGLAGQGAWYLASLRLAPVFPFFLVNLTMGLTAMPLRTFWWVSQLAMLPGTAVYVNAGARLGSLESLREVATPGVLASLGLLAVFPLVAKWALARFGPAGRTGADGSRPE